MPLLGRRKTDPTATLERELELFSGRRAALEAKRAEAVTALVAATDERRQALLDADLDDASACARRDQLCRDAKDRLESLVEAVVAIDARIADVQGRLVRERERAERETLARTIAKAAEDLTAANDEYAVVATKLVRALQEVTAHMSVAPEYLPRISALVLSDLPSAVGELLNEARSHAAQIESGARPLARPPVLQPESEPAPAVERQRIFCLSPIRWHEGQQVICAPRFGWATPPRQIAERAVSANLADWPDAPRTQQLISGFGIDNGPADPAFCVDLDTLDRKREAQTLPPDVSERTGPARMLEVSVNRV